MYCKIISSNEKKEYQNIEKIVLPTLTGEIEILKNHSEIFGLIGRGKIILKNKENNLSIEAVKGIFYFKNNQLIILL